MKGKIAFVIGAAVGYVLGSRAGRERYEQIKRGAATLWNTDPVQQGVGVVRGVLDDRADEVKAFIRRASSDAFANLARQTSEPASKKSAAKESAAKESSTKESSANETTSKETASKKSTAKRPAAKRTPAKEASDETPEATS